MAFLVDDSSNALVSNLWTREPRRFADDPADLESCFYWQAVPSNDTDLSEWLQVVPNPVVRDRSRPYTVTHVPDADDGTEDGVQLYEVGVRIQGFLERFNMASTGNWDGKEHSAVKAVQSVVLSGGGHSKAWTATLKALNRIVSVVTRLVQPDGPKEPVYDLAALRSIYLQRRVFVKPSEESTFHVPTDAAHRGPELHEIRASWHLDQPMEFGILSNEGTLKRGTSLLFRPGNFVDVTAHVEVVVNKNGRVRVQFRPERVVLLDDKDGVKPQVTTRTVKILKRPAPAPLAEDDADVQRKMSKRVKMASEDATTSQPQLRSARAATPSDLDIMPLGLPPPSATVVPSLQADEVGNATAYHADASVLQYSPVHPVRENVQDDDDDSIPGDLPGLFGDHDGFAYGLPLTFDGVHDDPGSTRAAFDEDLIMQEAE